MATTDTTPLAANPVERIHQVAAKVYIEAPENLVPRDYVDVFHEWIRLDTLPELVIDVTDYSHVHHGPGVMLIGHEGHYSVDDTDGRLGLTYWFKRDEPGPLVSKARAALERTLRAAALLEKHPRLANKLRFRGDEARIILASRLLAPNTAETFDATSPVIEEVLSALYAGAPVTLEAEADATRPFAVAAKTTGDHRVSQLLERLAAS